MKTLWGDFDAAGLTAAERAEVAERMRRVNREWRASLTCARRWDVFWDHYRIRRARATACTSRYDVLGLGHGAGANAQETDG